MKVGFGNATAARHVRGKSTVLWSRLSRGCANSGRWWTCENWTLRWLVGPHLTAPHPAPRVAVIEGHGARGQIGSGRPRRARPPRKVGGVDDADIASHALPQAGRFLDARPRIRLLVQRPVQEKYLRQLVGRAQFPGGSDGQTGPQYPLI